MYNKERYNRNILINAIGESGQEKFLNSKILIAGAGGLGSTVITNLASVGIGKIGIIDNDKVELSNLNRQFIHRYDNLGKNKTESAKEWVNNFNPDINVEIYPVRLDENNYNNIFDDYDIIVDCFDSYKSKFLLNKIAVEKNKILVHGGVTEFYGQIAVIIPGETACLNCLIPDTKVNTPIAQGIISPAVTTIASIQSMEIIKIILNEDSLLSDKLLIYNGLKQQFKRVSTTKNPQCTVCNKK